MRVLTGQQVLARIFMGEAATWHRQPLHLALLERLRREDFAGATAFRGVAGFGARSLLHTTQFLRLSEDLPLVIEVVDSVERIERLKEILDEMLDSGLVTLEKVDVLKYGSSQDD